MGVVVNQDSPLLLGELCRDHEIQYAGDPLKRVRKGGPVQPEQGLVLYGPEHGDPEGRAVIDGLHVSASRGTLGRLCGLSQGRFQCYAGYAGWAPGQLEHEIAAGAWIVSPADPAMILDGHPDEIWAASLRALGIDPTMLVPGGDAQA
jgi:putative transcriptional regulator